MPTELENLKTRRATIATELAALVSKPTYGLDGQNVQWVEHRKSLVQEYTDLNELILLLEPWDFSITATP